MKLGLIIGGAVVALLLIVGMCCTVSYISFRQDCVSFENNISAQDKEMQNVDTEVTNTLITQGLSAKEYGKLVKDAIKAANSGRYGADGSKAMMQWIKEQNPNIDADIFKKFMKAAEAGYAKFAAAQRKKIDLARSYKNLIERKQQIPIWGSIVTSGFPRKPWEDFERIIVSEDTAETWKTGIKKPVNPYTEK